MCIDSLIAINSLSLACIRQCYEQRKGGQAQIIYCYQRIYTHCFIENQICVAFMLDAHTFKN